MNTHLQLPARVDATLLHVLCKTPVWNGVVDVGVARKIVVEQLEHPAGDGSADLTPLFQYLAQSGPHGIAARCVREVADELAASGRASFVPELVLSRQAQPTATAATAAATATAARAARPDRERKRVRTVTGTRVHLADRAPLILFACFIALLASCFVLRGG